MRRHAIIAAFSVLAASANAAVIKPDSVTASSEHLPSLGYFDPVHTINGSGLTGAGTDITQAHANYAWNNHWTSGQNKTVGESITWSFNTAQTVGGIYIWNHRSNSISSNSGYEPVLFDLVVSGATGNVLLSFDDLDLAPDNAYAQLFGFGSAVSGVKSVKFTVGAIQLTSSPWTGLAEVAFETNPVASAKGNGDVSTVPIPPSLPLLGGALVALGLIRRRRD